MKIRKTITIDIESWKKLKIIAIKNGNTISQQIAQFVSRFKINITDNAIIEKNYKQSRVNK